MTEFCQSFNVPFVSLMCPFIVLSHNVHTTNRASKVYSIYESIATVGESRVWWRADFQSGSRVLKKVF